MESYIAFLRGINVGGHVVKKERLKSLFEELGFDNVSTFIASGNVVFDAETDDAAGLECRIERSLAPALGYSVSTFVRTAAELKAVADAAPIAPTDAARPVYSVYVVFLHDALDDEVHRKLFALQSPKDELKVQGREIYWLCRQRMSESPLFARDLIGKAIGAPITTRNLTTIRKLVDKVSSRL